MLGTHCAFYQLEHTEVGPVTTFSVAINSNFTWLLPVTAHSALQRAAKYTISH